MADDFETVRIRGENVTPDLLVWRRYKRKAPGILPRLLAMNPQVHEALAAGPFLPVGALVKIPIDRDLLNGTVPVARVVKLYGDA